jgi:hypothetical protein
MWNLINSHIGRLNYDHVNLHNMSSNELNNFFINLGSNAVQGIVPLNDFRRYLKNRVVESFYLYPVEITEINSIVKSLPSKTSCDSDGLSTKLIKHLIASLASPLCTIFNKSFSQGLFPDSLKVAKVIPIFKSGDVNCLGNYRPISLLPVFSKILEKLILVRISSFFNKHNVLSTHQHGFRPSYSTDSALADVLDYITTALDKKFVALALFIDVSKAFDSLNHKILLDKLEHYGVRGIALQWFFSYLSSRFQFTGLNSVRSLLRLITTGIPQGSVLGPYLYLVYVNDIFNITDTVK